MAKGGLIVTSGNSDTTNVLIGGSVSRRAGNNKLALDAGLAYGSSNVLVAHADDPTMPTVINRVDRQEVVTTNNWFTRGRYDRFITPNNAGYASGQVGADKIAGKTFIGGGQIGYSRQLVKNDHHTLVAEIGYDLSYERYVQQPNKEPFPPVTIHSARIFVGETAKITPTAGATASIETFLNLNSEPGALNVKTGMPGVDAFHDTRVIGKVGLTTTIFKALSAALGITVRYDQNPAPLPIPPGAPAGATYATGFQPFAETTDTIAEMTLIYTFL
jgi:hypothetical protein